jgi:Cft2 family RNA processing exonuclease
VTPLSPLLEARPEGLYSPAFDAFLDPREAVPRAILTHAHADHAAAGHGEVWATAGTLDIYRLRHPEFAGGARAIAPQEEVRSGSCLLTLHPAGHVLGSAQVRLEVDGESVLVTGDVQRQRNRTAAPVESPRSDVLVIETTFGLPVFRFPRRDEAEARLVSVCREALDAGETPVLLAYAFGKSQEVALTLAQAGVPTVLHGAAWKLLPAYERAGFAFPLSRPYESGPPAEGEALVVPPLCARTPIVQKVKRRRVVYLSGWAVREASRADFDADVRIPLSDHADFPGLLEHVAQVAPSRVVASHGYASDFARILAARGVEAWALSGEREPRAEEEA